MRLLPVLVSLLILFPAPVGASDSRPRQAPIRFEELGAEAGARLVHETRDFGEGPQARVLEMFTSGGAAVAVGDFDGDGWDDLFVTSSDLGSPNRLLRNVTGERGRLAFTDVTDAAGVAGGNDERSIVSDALWLDFDGDGRLDLLVARFGTPVLYRNLGPSREGGGPRFREVGAAAGLTRFGNTIAVIAFDADGDGWLDIVLGNYFPPENLLDLSTPHVLPEDLDDAHNGGGVTLWRNVPAPASGDTGGRRFVEVTEDAGLAHHTGWTLDLGHADLDDDGDQDLYLAGDYGTDRLFWNRGDGTFEDGTEDALGFDTRKGMNVDFGDFDRDGRLDVYVTNITDEYMRECNMLWHNLGDGTFLDVSRETGTCDTDWGWAAKFADFDNDGWEDLYAVNGLRSAGEENYIPVLLEMILTPDVDFSDVRSYPDIGDMTWSGYQAQRLFRNLGDGTFREIGGEAGVATDHDGRGIGLADFDRDGRVDIYQTNADQPALLFRNRTEPAGHWLQIELVGSEPNRNAIGARVILRAGGQTFLREVNGGNGYASQSTTRLHFGLGETSAIDEIEVRWPGGRTEIVRGKDGLPLVPDRILTLRERATGSRE